MTDRNSTTSDETVGTSNQPSGWSKPYYGDMAHMAPVVKFARDVFGTPPAPLATPTPHELLNAAIDAVIQSRNGRDLDGDIYTVAKEYAVTFTTNVTEYDKQLARAKFARILSAACAGNWAEDDVLDLCANLKRLAGAPRE